MVPALMSDFITGYLAKYGALVAVARRATEGGSWQVHASLCRSAMYVQDCGNLDRFHDVPGSLTEA